MNVGDIYIQEDSDQISENTDSVEYDPTTLELCRFPVTMGSKYLVTVTVCVDHSTTPMHVYLWTDNIKKLSRHTDRGYQELTILKEIDATQWIADKDLYVTVKPAQDADSNYPTLVEASVRVTTVLQKVGEIHLPSA